MFFSVQEVLLYFQTINSNRFRYRDIIYFATNHIYPDYKDNSKLNRLCDEYGRKSIKLAIIFMNLILLSTVQAMIGSMIECIQTGHFVSFLAIKLPFIDEDFVWGFHLNLMIQTTITTFGTIGGLSIEMTSCVINSTIMLCVDIIKLNCSELKDQLEGGRVPRVKILAKLQNIFMKYEDLDHYLVNMADLNYWRLFSAPVLIVYSVPMCIFCQFAVSDDIRICFQFK